MDKYLKKLRIDANKSQDIQIINEEETSERREAKKESLKPWVEKYRPTNMSQIVYQTEVVSMLDKCVSDGADLPNLLFYGPPGTGKTSTIVALAKQLFGDAYRSRVLELNASDERGIAVIREKVKTFAQSRVSSSKSMPAYKLIILDECDSMTRDAQTALRRTMETHSDCTRFCLICNYVSRIIEPIVSRCSTFRFKLLNTELAANKLRQISDAEGVTITDEVINELVSISEGDLRRAITLLQSTALIKNGNESVTIDDIEEVAAHIPKQYIDDFFVVCGANSYEKLITFAENLISDGYCCAQFVLQLHEWLIGSDQSLLSDSQKSTISEQIALVDKRLLDGADEYLQILNIGSVIIKTMNS